MRPYNRHTHQHTHTETERHKKEKAYNWASFCQWMSLYSHERKSSNVVVNGVCICTIKSVTPWYFVCCMAFEMVWGCEEWKKGGSQWREGKIIWTTQINWCWDSFIQVRTRISLCVCVYGCLLVYYYRLFTLLLVIIERSAFCLRVCVCVLWWWLRWSNFSWGDGYNEIILFLFCVPFRVLVCDGIKVNERG